MDDVMKKFIEANLKNSDATYALIEANRKQRVLDTEFESEMVKLVYGRRRRTEKKYLDDIAVNREAYRAALRELGFDAPPLPEPEPEKQIDEETLWPLPSVLEGLFHMIGAVAGVNKSNKQPGDKNTKKDPAAP
jgi:hypothetical protein